MSANNPTWANIHHPDIDFDDSYYFAAPKKQSDKPESLDEIDPEDLNIDIETVCEWCPENLTIIKQH